MPATKTSPNKKVAFAPPLSLKPTAPADIVVWERQPGESVQAYARFVRYRCTSPDERSYRKLGVALSLVQRWARRWSWPARTEAYDDYLFSLRDGVSEAASLRARAKAAHFADRAMDKATAVVEQLNPSKTDGATAVALARTASDIGRLALGLSQTQPGLTVNAAGGQVGVLWGGESPAWLSSAKPNETVTEPKRNGSDNGRVKVLANDTPAPGGVHALPIDAEIVKSNEPSGPRPLNKKIKD